MTKLQEELEAASTNKLEWQSQSIQTRILIARRVSQKSHGVPVEGWNRLESRREFTVEEVRRTSSAVEAIFHPQSSPDERQEKGTDKIQHEHERDAMRMPDEELNRTKHTQRKNSRTSSNEDKVEIQDIMSECKVGNVDMKT